MKQLLLVFIGGGTGSLLRFLIGKIVPTQTSGFPWNTLLANAVGCFLIGFLMGWMLRSGWVKSDFAVFWIVGFCGGLTTFSSFAYENYNFLQQGAFLNFLLYTGLSVVLGLIFLFIGFKLHRSFL